MKIQTFVLEETLWDPCCTKGCFGHCFPRIYFNGFSQSGKTEKQYQPLFSSWGLMGYSLASSFHYFVRTFCSSSVLWGCTGTTAQCPLITTPWCYHLACLHVLWWEVLLPAPPVSTPDSAAASLKKELWSHLYCSKDQRGSQADYQHP